MSNRERRGGLSRRVVLVAVAGVVVATAVEVAANAAPLPDSWQPHLWMTWPFLLVCIAAAVALSLVAERWRIQRTARGETTASPPEPLPSTSPEQIDSTPPGPHGTPPETVSPATAPVGPEGIIVQTNIGGTGGTVYGLINSSIVRHPRPSQGDDPPRGGDTSD